MSRELLERALIALKSCNEYSFAGQVYKEYSSDTVEDSIEEIESALAEPEQEPVRAMILTKNGSYLGTLPLPIPDYQVNDLLADGMQIKNLYTKPPRQEPVYLSEAEIDEMLLSEDADSGGSHRFARAIEQAVLKANGLIKDKGQQE